MTKEQRKRARRPPTPTLLPWTEAVAQTGPPHITVYRDADEVVVGTQDQIYSRRGLINRTTLTAAEIGHQIVGILERRLAAMRAELGGGGSATRS